MRRLARHSDWAVAALITAGAAALRLVHLAQVPADPFYDAAVRSMGLSWHNFFFGAFEPGGSVSIDKPPVDLWLQVASVKLLGFSRTSLKLPEALAGIAAVPLLFATVKRMWSAPAGIAAALALAVLPVEVITSRSDTMDGVMMALTVLALWLLVRACETGGLGWLLAGAAVLGVAFDVKLLESVVALPGLALLALLGLPGPLRRRLLALAAASVVYVAVALAWLTATLLFPAHDRPYAIGSTNGSAWNAAFVFNGTDRLSGRSTEPLTLYQPGHHYPQATQSQRDHIPIVPPSPTRLLARVGPLSGQRLGLELLVALLLGVPALAFALRERPARRLRLATAAGVVLWTLTGTILFSDMVRLHPRYVEGFTPALAALLGIGVAWAAGAERAVTARAQTAHSPAPGRPAAHSHAAGRQGARATGNRARLIVLAVALAACVYYVERLEYGLTAVWWITLAAACAAIALATSARLFPARARALSGATLACALAAVAALPVAVDISSIENDVGDAGYVGALPGEEQRLLSAYLRAHQNGARYELAAESATSIGSLIVQDARPVLVLTTYDARVFTGVARLQRLIAQGQVRYAFLNGFCAHASSINAACSAPALWIRAHGTDVSAQAGLSHGGLLYLLPGASS
jgi:4-amino-4-deoxy-L-arabinose transferase-like glycosyltransferase